MTTNPTRQTEPTESAESPDVNPRTSGGASRNGNRTPLWGIGLIAAFLAGVGGTAAIMGRHTTAPSGNGSEDVAKTPPAIAATAGASKTDKADSDTDSGGKSGGDQEGGGEEHKGDAAASTTVTLDSDAARNAGVRAEPLMYRTVRDLLTVPGTVEVGADRVAKVTPPVVGRVTRVLVHLGDIVQTGQPLAILDSQEVAQAQAAIRDADADLQQAQAQVRTAQAEVAQARGRQVSAEVVVTRQRELAQAGAFSQAPLQSAQSERSQAQSELLSAQAEQQKSAAALARSEKLFQAGIDSRAELEQAQTDAREADIRVDQAKARGALADQALEREQKVFRRDLLSQQAIQSADADARNARGDVLRAQTELQAAQTAAASARLKAAGARESLQALAGGDASVRIADGGRVTLLAPIGGTVAQQDVTLGQAVERSANLFTLENLSAVIVQASVPEQDVARVRQGQRAEITVASFPTLTFSGVVQSLASQLDEKTRTLAVRCLVENAAGRLRPEMFAQVRLEAGVPRRALVVPESALVTDESGAKAVYIANGDKGGKYTKRPVQVGRAFGGRVEITKGLEPGQNVVTQGAFVLKSEAAKSALKDND